MVYKLLPCLIEIKQEQNIAEVLGRTMMRNVMRVLYEYERQKHVKK